MLVESAFRLSNPVTYMFICGNVLIYIFYLLDVDQQVQSQLRCQLPDSIPVTNFDLNSCNPTSIPIPSMI